jgi:predicted GNAT family N-acyltransferase
MPTSRITVIPADWHEHRRELRAIRRAVFIVEQGVPEALEWDEFDARCEHALALADGTAIGTGRLTPEGRIGRMAVLRAWRGCGAGTAILQHLLRRARAAGHSTVRLHAQTHALAFYARQGFVAAGPEFMEADIPHREMSINLAGPGDQEPSRA